jgi:2-hydroxy fatty acid dioxygenase
LLTISAALVLAPFFVHIETLFYFGYRPEMARQLKNDVGTEIARVKREERMAKEAKKI